MITKHGVIDIETLGRSSNAFIATIGITTFAYDDVLLQATPPQAEFAVQFKLTQEDVLCEGRICADTLVWWMTHASILNTVRVNTFNPRASVYDVVGEWNNEDFVFYNVLLPIRDLNLDYIWGCSPDFDVSILYGNIRRSLGFEGIAHDEEWESRFEPWAYWQRSDVRTVRRSYQHLIDPPVPENTAKHDAVSDSMHEAQELSRILVATQAKFEPANRRMIELVAPYTVKTVD